MSCSVTNKSYILSKSNEKECECSKEKECQLIEENEEENDELGLGLENYYEPIKEEDDLRLEFVEIERIYDLLVTEQDIENMISKLEKYITRNF